MSRVYGTDGRYRGCVKPFPGFERVVDIGSIAKNSADASTTFGGAFGAGQPTQISFFRYVEIQREDEGTVLQGFLLRFGGTSTAQEVAFAYYDPSLGTPGWRYLDVSGTVGTPWDNMPADAVMDVTVNGRFMYITVENFTPYVVYFADAEASNFKVQRLGVPSALEEPPAPAEGASGETATGGYLQYGGTYGFAFRFKNSARKTFSGMSDVFVHTVSATTGTTKYQIKVDPTGGGWPSAYDTWAEIEAEYDYIELYRTIDASVAEGHYTSGILYKEAEVLLTTFDDTNAYTMGLVRDSDLTLLSRYDPENGVVSAPPEAGAVVNYQGTSLMGLDPADTLGGHGLTWTSVYEERPEDFSTLRVFRTKPGDGRVERFVESGDILYGFTPAVVYRIQKGGGRLTIGRLHYGRGLTGAAAVHEVGRDLLILTPLGLCVMDGESGNLRVISAVDRVLKEWSPRVKPVLASGQTKGAFEGAVHSAYDSVIGCSFFGYVSEARAQGTTNDTDDCIVVWHESWSVSLLADWPYIGATTGREIASDVLSPRAFFVTSTGVVTQTKETGPGTMIGMDETSKLWGGTAAAGSSTTRLIVSAGTVSSQIIGGELYYLTGANAGVHRRISAVEVGTGYVDTAAFPNTPAAGDQYSISPVVGALRLWPVPPIDPQDSGFQRRRLSALGVNAAQFSYRGAYNAASYAVDGFSSNANALWFFNAYRNFATTPALTSDVTATMTEVPSENYGSVPLDGVYVEPFVRWLASGVDFQLTDVDVVPTITRSRQSN